MKARLMTAVIGGAFALSLGASAATAQVVTIATGAQGSLADNSGQAVAKVLNDAKITARTQPLVGYLPLINSGEVDFGFSNRQLRPQEPEYAAGGDDVPAGNWSHGALRSRPQDGG